MKFKFREKCVTSQASNWTPMIGRRNRKESNSGQLTLMIGQLPDACDVTRSPGFFRHSDLGAVWGRFPSKLLIRLVFFVDEHY